MVAVRDETENKVLAVKVGQEVVVRIKNDIGILFELSTLVSDQGVNVLAVSGAVCGQDCVVRLITEDNRKTKEVLAEKNFSPVEEDMILVELPHRPGLLKQVTKTLAQGGIDIRNIYATAARGQDKCLLVLHSSNDEEALARLQEIQSE